MNISFSGCGFLGIYHVGVASAIREYAPDLLLGKISGASAGSIAACCLLCGCCLGQGTSDVLKIVIQARSRALGPLHPSFNMVKILRDGLRKILPVNAHEMATGRLHVSLTRFTDGENVLVSKFDTKEELIQAVICSTFIPFYCGTVPPTFKGVRYIDGGWSDNCPVLDGDTITVSPFSGESDICPGDSDSASWMGFSLNNSSFRFTSRNLYRFSVALFPPHPEVMSRMCRQGFEDTLKFLAKNDLITCMRCISVRSCITLPEESLKHSEDHQGHMTGSPEKVQGRRKRLPRTSSSRQLVAKGRKRSISTPNLGEVFLRSESECESCLETAIGADSRGLPPVVVHTLKDAENLDKTLLGRIWRLRPVKWLRYLTIPCLLPWDIAYSTCIKLLEWLPTLPKDLKWLVDRASAAARFVASEIDTHRHLYSARFTCQLAVTELTYGGPTGFPLEEQTDLPALPDGGRSRRNSWDGASVDLASVPAGAGEYSVTERNFGFSVDMNTRKKTVRKLAAIVRQDSPSRSDIPAEEFANATAELEWEGLRVSKKQSGGHHPHHSSSVQFQLESEEEFDNLNAIVEYARRHESLMSYYYLDENQQVKVTEIYGIKNAESCSLRNGNSNNRKQSFRGQSIAEEETKREEQEEDSGLPSPTEREPGIVVSIPQESPELRDACCSPVKELSDGPWTGCSQLLRRTRSRTSLGGRHQMSHKRISAPPIGITSSDSDGEGSGELFVPERRRKTLSEDTSAYEAENSSAEEGI